MTPEQANRYIGCPWVSGGDDIETGINCWNFLRYIQREYFGIDVPTAELGDPMAQLFAQQIQSGEWAPVPAPFHGCGVQLKSGNDPHVGVWLDIEGGGVLHALEGHGVVWTRRSRLGGMGFVRLKYYRLQK